MAYKIIFNLLFTCTVCPYVVAPMTCPPGTFLYTIIHTGEQFCIECQDGSFVPYDDHKQTLCKSCEKIKEPELEILVSPCNKTHDAVIHCVDGYFRDEARNPRETGTCKKCTECPAFTGRPCGTYKDTVCCWDENYDVVPNHDGVPVCRERPWFCRRGHYFETKGYQCLPCPDKTFMPLDFHIQPECLKCREQDSYRPLHSVIIQPCNRTHAPVIRCEDGFFIKPNMGYRDKDRGCSPCTDCSTTDVEYEGRKCDGMEDTVCCPKANMTVTDTSEGPVCCPDANMIVVDTPDGPVCQDALKEHSEGECDRGQCPHQRYRRGAIAIDCAPCPDTGIPPGKYADHSTTVDPGAQETFPNNNQKSSKDFSLAYLFGGIVIGMVQSFVCSLIYKKLCRDCWPRQKASHKSPQPGDPIESVPLNASRDTLNEEIDDHSKELCCGNESDLHLMRESCEFVEDHHERFIGANSFAYEHLPQVLREDGKMAYIKAVSDLAVRLKVNHTSKNRPKNFPCHKLRGDAGAGIKRFGTGLVFRVVKKFAENNSCNPCPCRACSVYHGNARNNWAEFAVVTSAYVVYDDIESAKTSCRLWFDRDDDYIKARSLTGRTVEERNEKTPDVRIMHCITHDEEVSQKLEEKIAQLDNLRDMHNRKSTTEFEEEERLAVLISHQHALSKKISVGKATLKMDGGIQKWSYDLLTCPGSSGAPICILGMHQKSGILTTVHGIGNESTGFSILSAICG